MYSLHGKSQCFFLSLEVLIYFNSFTLPANIEKIHKTFKGNGTKALSTIVVHFQDKEIYT